VGSAVATSTSPVAAFIGANNFCTENMSHIFSLAQQLEHRRAATAQIIQQHATAFCLLKTTATIVTPTFSIAPPATTGAFKKSQAFFLQK
jgi:hypothetical protein